MSGDWVVVALPPLGESVTEGTVTRWLKGEGDHVEIDDPLLEVSTDKVDTEIPATATGIVRHITVAEDETAEVGATLCHIQPLTASARIPDTAQKVDPDNSPRSESRAGGAAGPSACGGEPPRDRATPADGLVAVTLPALGESITDGTVTRWLRAEGDHVEIDDPLLEVSTDKVDTEIAATATGVLEQITVAEDEMAEVGAVLCYLRPRAEQGDGDRVPVTGQEPGPTAVTVGFGWHLNTVFFELDACAIAVDAHDRVYSSSHFVSGNRQTPDGTIVHAGGDRLRPHAADAQAVYLNLAALPRAVEKIVFPVYICDGKNRGQHFGQLRTAYIRLIDPADGTEIVRYDLPEHVPADTALIFGELYRSGAQWRFRPDFQGNPAGMAGIAQHFGVDVLLSGHYVHRS
ncbi:TerD family protein [Streptomyces actinomycinicus]